MHPFRFGVQVSELPFESWRERVHWYEDLGFSTITTPDHYQLQQWDPIALQAAVAGVTRSAAVGSTVLNSGLRQPIDLARMAATVAAIAAGGCELGIGAGWIADDFEIAGVPFEEPRRRLDHFVETIRAIQLLWSQETTDVEGEFVHLKAAPSVLPLPLPRLPKLLLGGTRRRSLGIAGEFGDIVSVFPSVRSGEIGWPEWAASSTIERTTEQVSWALAGAQRADRDADQLELSTQVSFTAVADQPGALQESLAAATGVNPVDQDESTIFLTGTPAQARERLLRRREATGLNYFVIFDLAHNYANPGGLVQRLPGDAAVGANDRYLEALAEHVLQPLAGQ